MNILRKTKRNFIYEIFDDIQQELHKKGKQHPTYIWNDQTRYIRFKRRNIESAKEIQMTQSLQITDDNNNEKQLLDNFTDEKINLLLEEKETQKNEVDKQEMDSKNTFSKTVDGLM